MTISLWKSLSIGLSLATTGSVFALGLGNLSGQPILGQPLTIEISLLGTEEGIPDVECFRIRPPMAEIESGFVLRNASIQVQGERNRAKLIVASSSPVREPVIEFGIAVGCGFGLSKDYVLLTAEPSKIASPSDVAKLSTQVAAEPQDNLTASAKSQKANVPTTATDQLLHVEIAVTLQELAQQKYPLQPKAREKFIRMMSQANPNISHDDQQIAAGSELQIPPGLPVRRLGAYHPEPRPVVTAAESAAKPVIASSQPPAAKKPAAVAKPQQDLLVLGTPGLRNAAELLAEAERLTAILTEQTNAQNATAEKITQLEDTLKALKKHFDGIESRINKIEAERQAEKLAAKPASNDFLELLLAVLAGGAIGGSTLHLYNRMKLRRSRGPGKPGGKSSDMGNHRGTSTAAPSLLKPLKSEGLSWQKGYEPAGNVLIRRDAAEQKHGQQPLAGEVSGPATQPSSPQNDFDFVTK